MIGLIFGFILKLLGPHVLSDVFGYLEKKSDNETERQRINTVAASSVMQTAMSHSVFWVAWGVAAIPMALWFGYGMLNTIAPWLPHVAVIPLGLKPYAEVVWSNIFWTGGVVASVSVAGQTLSSIFRSIFRG